VEEGFKTAYPRRSRQNIDPSNGLATIEAIFIAAALLGNWDLTLLAEYYFGQKFIQINRELFLELGIPPSLINTLSPLSPRFRSSQQRRRSRGRLVPENMEV
jgi:hypothetical protein